jgi:hypothetical protein
MFNSGFVPSVIDGSEIIFEAPKNIGLPKQFSYMKYLPTVLNQGSKPTCVPCSISAFLNWDINLPTGSKEDNSVDVVEIFKKGDGQDDGMTFKSAFKVLRTDGVSTDKGNVKISRYAKINSYLSLKFALITNGPCVGALPVYDSLVDEFWVGNSNYIEGYHAIAIVGYNDEGFIIRNSWGKSYGEDGYYFLKNEDFSKFIEIWTLIK